MISVQSVFYPDSSLTCKAFQTTSTPNNFTPTTYPENYFNPGMKYILVIYMPKLAIIYVSGLGRTKKMAETIAEGAKTIKGVEVVLKPGGESTASDVKNADAIMLGASTYGYKINQAINPLLQEMEKLNLKGKVGVAFGSYGWSGEGVTTLISKMKSFGMNVIEPGLKVKQEPDDKAVEECFKLGRTVAEGIKK